MVFSRYGSNVFVLFIYRVYSIRSVFGGTSTLTFRNFLERDAGLYMCRAWLGAVHGWVERNVEIRIGKITLIYLF